MRTLFRLFVLAILVVGVFWVFQHRELWQTSAATRTTVGPGNSPANLDVQAIGDELKRTGQVVRRKAVVAAHKLDEATEDARTTAAIKAKLALDSQLSVINISVDTTDGRVTLSGRVEQPEDIARAIRLAMDTDNVQEVISTLQVHPKGAKPASRTGAL
jgi:hypothetical protein